MQHDVYATLQGIWLGSAGGPEILAGFRAVTGAMSLLAASGYWKNTLRNAELESTWSPSTCRRFRVISWMLTVGLTLAALYYFLAGVFELDRTSSPFRLLWGNVAMSTIFFALHLLAVFWRGHYARKRRLQGKA